MQTRLNKIDWRGGIATSLLVGSILILINQWDALLGLLQDSYNQGHDSQGQAPFSYSKALLTYVVPFCVYQYGRIKSRK